MAPFHPSSSQANGVSDKKLVESKCLLRTFLRLYVYSEKKVLGRIVDSEKVETAVSLDPFCIIRLARYEDSDDPQKLVERISLSFRVHASIPVRHDCSISPSISIASLFEHCVFIEAKTFIE